MRKRTKDSTGPNPSKRIHEYAELILQQFGELRYVNVASSDRIFLEEIYRDTGRAYWSRHGKAGMFVHYCVDETDLVPKNGQGWSRGFCPHSKLEISITDDGPGAASITVYEYDNLANKAVTYLPGIWEERLFLLGEIAKRSAVHRTTA